MSQRTCTIEGCGRKHRARGLCSSHYNQAYQPDRHRKVAVECAGCGEMVEKYPSGGRRPICSLMCRAFVTWGRWPSSPLSARPACVAIVGPIKTPRVTTPPVTIVSDRIAGDRPGVFVAGKCSECGTDFVTRSTTAVAKYCSPLCGRKAARRAYAVKRGRFKVSDRLRLSIYRRDNWTCQLCFELVEPDSEPSSDWYPSLDHIVPQSVAHVPDHSAANLRTAHFWCNSVRNDGRGEDFFDVARSSPVRRKAGWNLTPRKAAEEESWLVEALATGPARRPTRTPAAPNGAATH